MVVNRWFYVETSVIKKLLGPMPWYAVPYWRYVLSRQAHGHGIYRHTPEEVQHIAELNLDALKNYIGWSSGLTVLVVGCSG